ncbi:MAG: cation-efflux pump [Acidobacteriota bacterium]|nr:cation-efflux pump [Acidobacteriota bacterium]
MSLAAIDDKPPGPSGASADRPAREKRSAAVFSVSAAVGVTLLKLAAGLLTGSLGMLSEAAHSGVDLIASAITLFSVYASDRPADEEHNYGHGKIESLSAFLEVVIMLASCVWLVTQSIRRILFHSHLALRFSAWPFAVLLLSIVVDYARSRSLARVARAHRSEALAADAVHFATDMWSSGAVLVGLAAAFAGERFHIAWLEYGDPVAALVVSGVIVSVSWHLTRTTIDTLLDAAPSQQAGEDRRKARALLESELAAIPGVLSVDRLRTRRSGANTFADLTLGLPRNLTFQRSEQLTTAATDAVRRHWPGADVVVHSVPYATVTESVHDRVRAVAARRNLAIHEISVQQFDPGGGDAPEGLRATEGELSHGGLHIEQHLEVPESMPLRQAHELVTELEAEMRREVPEISSVVTHIESEGSTIERPSSPERDSQLEDRLREVARSFPEILDIHDVFITRRAYDPGGAGQLQVTCHCTLTDDLPMVRVHAIITLLEGAFKLVAPEVDRLLIHPEPATDNRR